MDRAIVLIGVQRTGGGLPPLPAVGDAIGALRAWAAGQGIPDEKIAVVSDLDGQPVSADAVFDAVAGLENATDQAAARAADQLIASRLTAGGSPGGLAVRGARIEAVHTTAEIIRRDDRTVELRLPPSAASASVLVRLDAGGCAVVTVLRDYSAVLTVEDGQLIDVWYAKPGPARPATLAAWRARADIAVRSRYGLPPPDAPWPDYAEDPALAVYHAYALADAGRRPDIPAVQRALLEVTGVPLFDLDLLVPGLVSGLVRGRPAAPGFPLMGRGWALLGAAERPAPLPRPLSSHWTLFPGPAFGALRAALEGS